MTVGIAAVCDYGRHIVLASDEMISTEHSSGDKVALKMWSLHRDWAILYAGNDISPASPVYNRAKSSIDQKKPASLNDVTDAMVNAYRAQLQETINAYLSPLNLTQETFFTEKTRAVLGDALFTAHHQHIMNLDLECEFLVAGFDKQQDTAHVSEIVNPGKAVNQDVCGFSAIGSGAVVANHMLFFHSFNNRMDLVQAIYHVCAAKFITESPGEIGETTDVVVLKRDGEGGKSVPYDLSPDFIADIRRAWQYGGAPRFAPAAEPIIVDGMKNEAKFRRVIFG